MNYIKKLQAENEALRQQMAQAEAALAELKSYLYSDKFSGPCENYVNVNDVLLRLREVDAALSEAVII